MTENNNFNNTENERYCVRAGYWHNYTGIGRCEDENLTTNKVCDLINEQQETITEQASQIDFLKDENKHMRNVLNENKQLKQRNNRQAKQLDRLYHLIEEKDWRTLTDILDDFKRYEEQLQKEWGTYGDVE